MITEKNGTTDVLRDYTTPISRAEEEKYSGSGWAPMRKSRKKKGFIESIQIKMSRCFRLHSDEC
jgi:hypothetical protein